MQFCVFFQISSSVLLALGTWLFAHKDSFISITSFTLENEYVKVGKEKESLLN